MAAAPDQFEGFMIRDHKKWTEFTKEKFTPKTFEEYDVDIEHECCGVCGSDVHTITGGWGEANLPICVGHEMIGKVLRVGSKVSEFKAGDRVGVGAQVQSCMKCPQCKSHNENYCPQMVDTYGAPYNIGGGNPSKEAGGPMTDKDGNQIFAQGGYSSHSRVHEQFVFKIPEHIASTDAGPMMCAGLTVYSPLKRAKCGPGKKIAILGIGGLGHFGILWARAMGAEVWALSHTSSKEPEARQLGAHHFVSTQEKDWFKPLAFTFDFILNAADMTNEFALKDYMSTLSVNGCFHNVGLPDKPLPEMMAQDFTSNGSTIGGSHLGSKKEAIEMLQLASEKNIKPMVELIDISEQGCAEAVQKVKTNDVRFRVTLTGFHQAFGTGKE